jgi:hypothetical protein
MEMKSDALNREEVPIYRVVLTGILRCTRRFHSSSGIPISRSGGPCGGKSTAVATISKRLLALGFRVFRVPEAATLLLTGTGVNPGALSEHVCLLLRCLFVDLFVFLLVCFISLFVCVFVFYVEFVLL